MDDSVSHAKLRSMVKRAIEFGKTKSIPLAPEIMRIPASNYLDPARWQLEVDRIFKRVPLMLAATAELPRPGDFKTLTAAGVPVLLVRADDGEVRAFVNSCPHRGANVATAETGSARRFVCPYHGWTYAQTGELLAVAAASEFGEIDKSCYGLRSLPAAERAGLIWVILDRNSTLDIDHFLGGYDAMLAHFGLESWHYFSKRVLRGPNWKVAYDGYLDFYHLPVLHRESFGPGFLNQAIFSAWGPHQRVQFPIRDAEWLEKTPEDQWPDETLLADVWTIFPHVSIASFAGGGRGVMVSQLMPGETVGESWTNQIYLMEHAPDEATAAKAHEQFDLLRLVVQDEDYFTGLRLQQALKAGAVGEVTFGRNEGGAQSFHAWVDRIVAADAPALNAMFRPA
jgi:nitrite reductase/ring-hydroxylating ferredoxin subunit